MKINRSVVIKLGIIAALLIIAPYIVPVAFELVLMADIMGLEALVLFLIYQSRNALTALVGRFSEFTQSVAATIVLLTRLYIFQPRVLVSHVVGSSVILIFTCSFALALVLWAPAIYLSTGGFA